MLTPPTSSGELGLSPVRNERLSSLAVSLFMKNGHKDSVPFSRLHGIIAQKILCCQPKLLKKSLFSKLFSLRPKIWWLVFAPHTRIKGNSLSPPPKKGPFSLFFCPLSPFLTLGVFACVRACVYNYKKEIPPSFIAFRAIFMV